MSKIKLEDLEVSLLGENTSDSTELNSGVSYRKVSLRGNVIGYGAISLDSNELLYAVVKKDNDEEQYIESERINIFLSNELLKNEVITHLRLLFENLRVGK